jgi:hypothetical protein
MVRRALLIACTGKKGTQGYIPGTLVDKNSYNNYLKSYTGGSWDNNEIIRLENPTKEDVEFAIYSMKIADFSFVVFSGHGGTYKTDNRVVIELGDEELNISGLRTSSDRQITILDTCRTYISEPLEKIAKSFTIAESQLEFINSRKIYEDAIMSCNRGNITLFSCGKNEGANDDGVLGGYFSYSLLQYCENWARLKESSSILNIHIAFEYAKKYLHSYLTTNQNPEISPSIRSNWFPFAISKNRTISYLGL